MNVLFVSHVSNKYGAARSLLNLVDGCKKYGLSPRVLLPHDGPLANELRRRGVIYEIMPIPWWICPDDHYKKPLARLRRLYPFLRHTVHSVPQIIKYVRRHSIDYIVTNSSATPVGALAAWLTKRPHVWQIREFVYEDYGYRYMFGLSFSALVIKLLSYRVIVISRALRGKYRKHWKHANGKVRVIYPGLKFKADIKRSNGKYVGAKNGVLTLAIVGYLHPNKGHREAILGVSEAIRRNRTKVMLKIVGEGDRTYLTQLKNLVAELNIRKYVSFTGYLDDPTDAFQEVDAVLVCSQSEAFGRTLVEAMFASKPIIGVNAGSVPELVKEGFNGVLYNRSDHHSLAHQIEKLSLDCGLLHVLGANGFTWAKENFCIERLMKEFLDTINFRIEDDGDYRL